jgi:broad specificity phosphatase PhoE
MTLDTLSSADVASAHSEATLALAKKESVEHLHGMSELYAAMRQRPLTVKAYTLSASASGGNVKTVHFVRHGQGFHNLLADIASASGVTWTQFSRTPQNPYVMPEVMDAPLTEKGRQQALCLQRRVREFDKQPQLIILSPTCRALQTGTIVFEHLVGNVPFLAHELTREESGVHCCDKRRPKSRQEKEFPMVDFSMIETEEDCLFNDTKRESKMELGERVYKFMEWLSVRPETNIAVASHSGWLLTLFNGICECDEVLKAWWQTGELRSVQLDFLPH